MTGYFVFLTLLAILAAASGRRPDQSRYEDLHNALREPSRTAFRGHGHGHGAFHGLLHGRGMRGHHSRGSGRFGGTADLGHSTSDQDRFGRPSRGPFSHHHRRMIEKMAGLFRTHGLGHGQGRGQSHGQGRGQSHGQGRGQRHHRGGMAGGMAGRQDGGMGGLLGGGMHDGIRFIPRGPGSRRHHGNNGRHHGGHHRSVMQHRINADPMARQPDVGVAGVRGSHHLGRGSRGNSMGPRYVVTR